MTKRKSPRRPARMDPFPTLLGPFRPTPLRPAGDEGAALRSLRRAAMAWSHIARNRQRWVGVPALMQEQVERARTLIQEGQLGAADLATLAHAGVVQVSVPYPTEEESWAARLFPWEFFLSFATKPLRDKNEPLIVLRHLRRSKALKEGKKTAPKRALFVDCAPASLDALYPSDSEFELLRAALAPPGGGKGGLKLERLRNPTSEALKEAIAKDKPDIIHIAGFDVHEGSQLLKRAPRDGASPDPALPTRDGILMRDDKQDAGFVSIEAEAFAKLLTAGGHRPLLVTFSTWNSAARIAAAAVVAGARTAIGLQDTFDAEHAEYFFASFYQRLRSLAWQGGPAFASAWTHMRTKYTSQQGTGIVLWAEEALVGPGKRMEQAAPAARLRKQLDARATHVLEPASIDPKKVADHLDLDIVLPAEVNYSLLHNNKPLFTSFNILNKSHRPVPGIDVLVELQAGETNAVYRQRVSLGVEDPKADLREAIKIPLTSRLLRGVREAIVSSVFIEVRWGDHVLRRETKRVRLLPADQWCFADQGNTYIWLPSFVLPRDAAIRDLLAKAQRYVRVLRDDPSAGFEGYQAIDEDRDNPYEDIDLQAQAIWSAIVHEWDLAYTNPPPTYASGLESQRLRTPSAILRERFGTCIDTSLLFAACMEMIDVYPVIFMLNDHAFPGYWRSGGFHDDFLRMSNMWVSDLTDSELRESQARAGTEHGWVLDKSAYSEIVRQIDEGRLVPLESTMLTESSGFWAAMEAARENNFRKRDFHSMLDIGRARKANVTPLPIWEEA